MGKTRRTPTKRARGGLQGGGGRRSAVARANGAGPTADLPTGGPVGADAANTGLEHAKLAEPNNSIGTTTTPYDALRLKAVRALEKLCDSDKTPANVRASAARTLLEYVGAIGSKAKRDEDQGLEGLDLEPETMTLADIDRELLRLGQV
jgi:hypothetical protein